MSLPRLSTLCRIAIALVFVIAGAMKLLHPAAFFADLLSYRVPLPEMLLRLVTVWLPWLEVLCGVGLLVNRWPETVRPLVTALCAIFVVMLAQAVIRGLDLNCGCLGTGGPGWLERPGIALLRAALLCGASVYVMLRSPS